MDVNEHKRLSNITLRHKLKQRNSLNKKEYRCKWMWETVQHYTKTHIKVKEQLVVRKDIDVNDHERLSNITLRHTLK
jgi:hypothetical protein